VAFKCPKCGGGTHTRDSRSTAYGVRRRRKCDDCEYRFSTHESVADIARADWEIQRRRLLGKLVGLKDAIEECVSHTEGGSDEGVPEVSGGSKEDRQE